MGWKQDIQDIADVAEKLDQNRIAKLAYTDTAFDTDDLDGVAAFDKDAEQNVPDAAHTDYNPTILNKGIRTQGASIPRNAWNHYLGRASINLNKLIQKFLLFLNRVIAMFAHNAFEWDADAVYAPGDICYRAETDGGAHLMGYYRRNSVTGIAGDPELDLIHWEPVQNKFAFSSLLPFRAPGYRRTYTVIDLTGGEYDVNKWYPAVTGFDDFDAVISDTKAAAVQVLIEAFCNGEVSGVADASRVELSVLSKFTGFSDSSTDIVMDYSFVSQETGTSYAMDNAPIGYSKLVKGRQAVVWLRGGSTYALWNSFGSTFSVQVSSYDNGRDPAISPRASRPFTITLGTVEAVLHTRDAVLGDEPTTLRQTFGSLPLPKPISGGTQLNALRLPGHYVAETASVANSCGNLPMPNPGAFTLVVQGDKQGANITVQRFTRKSSGYEYIRVLEGATVVVPWALAISGSTQADWTETDPLEPSFVRNKPNGVVTTDILKEKLRLSVTKAAVFHRLPELLCVSTASKPTSKGRILLGRSDVAQDYILCVDMSKKEPAASLIQMPVNAKWSLFSEPFTGTGFERILVWSPDSSVVVLVNLYSATPSITSVDTQATSPITYVSGLYTYHSRVLLLLENSDTAYVIENIFTAILTVYSVALPEQGVWRAKTEATSDSKKAILRVESSEPRDTLVTLLMDSSTPAVGQQPMPELGQWDVFSPIVHYNQIPGVLISSSTVSDKLIFLLLGGGGASYTINAGAQASWRYMSEIYVQQGSGSILVTAHEEQAEAFIFEPVGSTPGVRQITLPGEYRWDTVSKSINSCVFVAPRQNSSIGALVSHHIGSEPPPTVLTVTMPHEAAWSVVSDPVYEFVVAVAQAPALCCRVRVTKDAGDQIALDIPLPRGSANSSWTTAPVDDKVCLPYSSSENGKPCVTIIDVPTGSAKLGYAKGYGSADRVYSRQVGSRVVGLQSYGRAGLCIIDILRGTQVAVDMSIPDMFHISDISIPWNDKLCVFGWSGGLTLPYFQGVLDLSPPKLELSWDDTVLTSLPLMQEAPYGFEG